MCDVNIFFAHAMDHSISAVGPSRIRRVARDDILRLCLGNPRFAGAFWWSSLQREAMLRERVVALGRRNARARLAYLFCEFYWRYEAIDQVLDHTLVLPLTQAELGDTLGMTAIHVNRVLSDMRDDGLLQRSRARIELTDFEGLKALAEIDREYLHYSAPPPEVAAYFRESAA
jgi:CRP-like cAMP-binding protein